VLLQPGQDDDSGNILYGGVRLVSYRLELCTYGSWFAHNADRKWSVSWTSNVDIRRSGGEFVNQRLQKVAEFIRTDVAAWLSGSALVSINGVTLRRARLILGWVTVCR